MADKNLKFIIRADDQASGKMKQVGNSAENMGKRTDRAAKMAKIGLFAVATATAAVAVSSVKMARDFEKSMGNVSTLIDTGVESMDDMQNAVLEISKRTPVALDDLTSALYDVRSAGISAEDAMMVLEKSAQLGVAGLGSTAEAVDLATSAINGFNLQGEEAAEVFDLIQATVKSGKTTISELSRSFGLVAGTAKTAGVSFQELQAATAAMTTSGLKASVAQTGIRQAILAVSAPTKEMAGLIETMGYESGQAMIKQEGLVESLRMIQKATGGSTEQMKKAFGSVEALGVALSLAGEQADEFDSIMLDMADSAGILDEAFAKQSETFDAQYQMLKNNLNTVLIKLGSAILPVLNSAISVLIPIIDKASGWFDKMASGGTEMGKTMEVFADIIMNYVVPTVKTGFGLLKATLDLFKLAWDNNFLGIQTITKVAMKGAETAIKTSFVVMEGLFSATTKFMQGDFSGMADSLGKTGVRIVELNKGWINTTADIWASFLFDTSTKLSKSWNENTKTIRVAFGLMGNDIKGFWDDSMAGLAGFTETFSAAWGLMWGDIKNIFTGIWNSILKGLETMLNKAIGLINLLIAAINRALGRFGVNISPIASVSLTSAAIDDDEGAVVGKRATGGSVSGGMPYLVGERGPEVFTPQGSGSITPNNQLGGGVTINITGNTIDSSSRIRELADAVEERLTRRIELQKFGTII